MEVVVEVVRGRRRRRRERGKSTKFSDRSKLIEKERVFFSAFSERA